ncbi:cytochrome P450 78A9-like [Typha angustifolia]|uniref:cytochrome P450 78A9-like n=1 Tax=Typha angustifolia TaxID=59011 RepID=UPI003C2D34B6
MEMSSGESWWILLLTLIPTSSPPSIATTLFSIAILSLLAWLVASLLYWAHPGGHAWGKISSVNLSTIPGPRGFPLIGSIGLMSGLAHRHLAAAADRLEARRLMSLSLGETRAVVASHPDVAKEILNSPAFVGRPHNYSAYGLMFHRAIGFAPYGVYWRSLRRIAASHLFSPKQVEASAGHRSRVAVEMLAAVAASGGEPFRARRVIKRASLDYIMRTVFGKEFGLCAAATDGEAEELLAMVEEGYELLGENNWSDHFPLLASIDLQGIQARCAKLMPKVNRFVNSIIHQHKSNIDPKDPKDFVDILLSLQHSEGLSDSDIAAVLWEMIFRGTDAMAVLTEWTLARLVLHPDIQAKVHNELDRVIGRSNPVKECDVLKLDFLQAVLKETLRMHPPGPLLAWRREAVSDTYVDGRFVPAKTTAIVNAWAIGRDADVWENPSRFWPERFLAGNGVDLSVLGGDTWLAPFGSGTRSCPGKGMATAAVGFWLASLLHEYEWLPTPAAEGKGVDLSEVLRLSCEMAAPLEARVRPRRHV